MAVPHIIYLIIVYLPDAKKQLNWVTEVESSGLKKLQESIILWNKIVNKTASDFALQIHEFKYEF